MKVFRISGRDCGVIGYGISVTSAASMKVFRISGRDSASIMPTRQTPFEPQ